MKKALSILLLAFVVIFSLTACDGNKPEDNPPEHVHSFGEWETKKPATCIENGAKHRECSLCGEKESEAIPAIGHTEVIDAAVEATCTESGLTEGRHCSVCNAVIVTQTVVDAKGHTEIIDSAVEASCTKTGLTEGKHCSVCNEVLVAQDVIDALGHNYVNYTCQRCGDEYMAGIYDANYNLIASWDELVNTYGMDVSKDYTDSDYYSTASSPYYVLKNNSKLSNGAKLMIDNSVTTIGDRAFNYCDSLTSVVIPDSVTSIGDSAFFSCHSLTSITIPDSVTSIGSDAFYCCKSLTSITIPGSVTSIGDAAFSSCYNLTSITIGNSVTGIGSYAFCGCDSLTDVYYTGSEEQWATISIDDGNSNLTDANITYNYVPEE